jgi:Holliday junction resolvase-like predicted endonuclease
MSRDEEEVAVVTTETATAPEVTQATDTPTEATDATQAPVEGTNATEVAPAAPQEPAGPTAEEIQALLDAFQKAAQDAVDNADASDATMTEASVAIVKEAYGQLPAGPVRTKARKWLDERMRAEIGEVHIIQARAFMTLESEVKAAGNTRETIAAPPVDPTEAHIKRAAALFISANFALPGPDVAEDWATRVSQLSQSLSGEVATYRDYLKAHATWTADARPESIPDGTPEGTEVDVKGPAPTEPEVSEVVRDAARIAQGRVASPRKPRANKGETSATPVVRGPRSGERRDIKAHILEVFAGKPVGTFLKYGEVAKAGTSVAPNGDTSQGAVYARVKSEKWDAQGTGLRAAEEGGVQGIRKVA